MKIRQGGRNPHNLYIQAGDEPDHDKDVSIGYIRFPHVAAEIVRLVNAQPGGVVRTQTFVTDAEWERSEELRVNRLGPGQDDIPEMKDPERPSNVLRSNS